LIEDVLDKGERLIIDAQQIWIDLAPRQH
jgi:hypothetical protein